MDSPLGSSGFDRGEMIPPVPAPRYKRKLITNEDSKHSSNKQNTCVSEQTTEILPPPRRKHKHHSTKNLIPLTFQNNIKNESRESNFQVNTSSQEEKKIISNGKLSPTCNEKSVLEMEQRNHRLDPYKPNCLDLDEEKSSKMSEMTDAFREIVDSSILKNFINNRVLDIPLPSTDKSSFICAEQTSTQDSDVDDSEENRVNSSLSENSATIVGVFYKPEYSLLKRENENKFFNSNVSKESNPTVWLSSLVNDGNKKIVVPPNESMKIIKINKKDSEEDDSGVYFSDTKSPPHRSNDAEIINKNMNEEINASSELQLSKPFTCNDRDTFDNKSSDLGPKMYNEVLDCFEAQTVSALREEVTGRLSLCSELSKNKAVENWLDHRDYISKKNVINSSFSEYLRNMLEVEESEGSLSRSLSPYPLSTVDESSDVSETGPNDEVDFVGESYTSKACTVPCSVSETRENRNVDTSDKYVSSLIDTNSVNNVNNECTEVTQCKVKSISFSETPKSNMNDIEMLCPAKEVRMSNENNTSQYNLFYTETNHYVSVSPSIEHGAVNKLISFFETVHTEENFDQKGEFDYEEEIDEITQGVDLLKQDSLVYSDTFSHVGLSLNNEINVIAHNNLPDEYENQPYPSIFEVFNGKEETFVDEYLEEENVSTEIIFPNGRSKLEHVASVHTEENLDQKGPFECEEKIDEITQDVDLLKLDSLVYSDTFRHVDLSLNNEINAIGHYNFPDEHKNQPDPSIFEVVNGKEETFADECLEEENISTESICPNNELELVASTNYDDLELYPSKIINVESFEQDIFPLPEKEFCLPTKVKTFDFENPTTIDFEENENLMSQSNPSFDMSDKDMDLDRINYVIETQADFKELSPPMEFSVNNVLPVTLETNQVAGINYKSNDSIVPNFNVSTKDTMLESDDMFCSFKPTRIPIVILNETDILSAPIGSIELHPADCLSEDNHNQAMASEMCNGSAVTNVNNLADEDLDDTNEESMLESSVTVTLEKHWGSLGLKIKGDADGVVISDILAGGAAGQSGLIFQGDRLVGVNGSCVRNPREAEEKLRHSPDIVHLQLQRQQHGITRSLPRHRLEEEEDMGSNMSRHSGKGLTGRRSQSSGNLCNGKAPGPGVARFFSPCGRGNDTVGPRDRYKFCGSLPNHLDANEEAPEAEEYRNNNNVNVRKKNSDVVLRLQPLVPKGISGLGAADSVPQDQGYGSERSPEDEVPPDLPPPTTVSQLTCPVHHPGSKPVYPFLHKNSTFTVTLLKGTRGLGLSVTGGVDTEEPWPGLIRVKRLFPHQPAWQSGQLATGDFLLVVNNTSLVGLTNYEALEVLRTTPAEVVLTVCRPPPELQVLSAPPPADTAPAPPPPRRDNPPSTSTSSLQLPLKRMESFGEFELTLKKVNGSLGFTLRKEDESILGHYVRALVREPALSDGRIKPGDKIVAVNGVDMSPMSHEEAVMFLRQCGQEVHLRLYRDPVQTPVQALSPTEHHRTIKPILRKEAQDMLSDLAVKKSMSPNESSGSSTLSKEGRTSSPRKRRLTKTPSPDLGAERTENHLSWSDEVLERISPGGDGERPRRPDTLNFAAERKPHFQFSAISKTEENLASLDSLDCGSMGSLGVGPLPSEPVSMPPLMSSTSDSTVGFSYRNPAYRSANPAPTKSKSSLSEDLPENRCSDNDLTVGASGDDAGDGSKGLLKWKGVVFTPDDGAETTTATSPDDSISQITEVDSSSNNQVLVVELNRGWNSRLGFSLQQSGRNTLISAIHPDSVASRDGRLKVGDQLIMVNDESIEGMSTTEVINLLRKIRGSICITVWRKSS